MNPTYKRHARFGTFCATVAALTLATAAAQAGNGVVRERSGSGSPLAVTTDYGVVRGERQSVVAGHALAVAQPESGRAVARVATTTHRVQIRIGTPLCLLGPVMACTPFPTGFTAHSWA